MQRSALNSIMPRGVKVLGTQELTMDNLEKAAAFGAVMGKRASLLKKADHFYDGASGKKYGDPSLKAPAELSANQVRANEQLQGNVPIPGVQEGPAGKNRDMARMQHYGRDQSNADVANLKPNTLAAERSAQQKDSDGKAISTVASMLPFSRVANVPLGRAPLTQAPSPMAAAKSFGQGAQNQAQRQYVTESGLMKTIGPDRPSPFKDIRGISGRGSIKPPTPSMPSSFDPMKTIRPNDANPFTSSRSSTPVSIPADDAMRQWGWKFSDKPPVGKPFTKLPNQ